MAGGSTPLPDAARRGSSNAANTTPKSKDQTQPTNTPSPAPANGVARTRSVRTGATGSPVSARAAAAKRPTTAASNRDSSRNASDDDTKAENASLVEELRTQLRKVETTAEEREKELFVVQSRLDDAQAEQAKMEEASHGTTEKIESLENDKKEALRRIRDLEAKFESSQTAASNDKEEAVAREEELNLVIQRLKESLLQKESRMGLENRSTSRTGSLRGRSTNDEADQTGSQSPNARDSSQSSNSKLVHQKDKIIEDLRMELAEVQIRLVEMENAGGGRVRELERILLETRMNNAKLMEDNESYQVLLSEKTLNGDLAKVGIFTSQSISDQAREPQSATRDHQSSSLADELENANSDGEQDTDQVRKLEAEVAATKEQNKALTLYINKIISRLLQNEQFESLFSEGLTAGEGVPLRNTTNAQTEKELPPAPVEVQNQEQENAAPSLLQRAGSLFGGRNKPRPQRPTSIQAPSAAENLAAPAGQNPPLSATSDMSESAMTDSIATRALHEDPNLAPSLPINRGAGNRASHRRSRSDWSSSMMNSIPRGSTASNPGPSGSPPSASSRQASYSALTGGPPPPLILEDNEKGPNEGESVEQTISKSDVASDSGYAESTGGSMAPSDSADAPSPPRSSDGKPLVSNTAFSSGSGGKMRPLRLVQERKEAEEAALAEKKAANRSSFLGGWFQRASSATSPPATQTHPQMPPRSSFQEQRPTSGGSQGSS